MKKTLFIFGPYDEFTMFIKFNSFIRREKQKKEYNEIIAIVPYRAAGVISEADKILTVSHQFHVKTNTHYPGILDPHPWLPNPHAYAAESIRPLTHRATGQFAGLSTDPRWRTHLGYMHSGFMERALQYIKQNFNNYDIAIYAEGFLADPLLKKPLEFCGNPSVISLLLDNNVKIINVLETRDPASGLFVDTNPHDQFVAVGKSLREGMKILPFKEDYDAIKEKFGQSIDAKTYVIHSRGFKNKQPHMYNAEMGIKATDFHPIIEKLMNEGYRFINIGFPPAPSNFHHDNYVKWNADLSYSEYLAFCRLVAGWIMFSDAGGWLIHICSDLDIFSIGWEWSHFGTGEHGYRPILDNRLLRKDVYTADFRNGGPKEFYECLINHKPTVYSEELPSLKQRVIIIDE